MAPFLEMYKSTAFPQILTLALLCRRGLIDENPKGARPPMLKIL